MRCSQARESPWRICWINSRSLSEDMRIVYRRKRRSAIYPPHQTLRLWWGLEERPPPARGDAGGDGRAEDAQGRGETAMGVVVEADVAEAGEQEDGDADQDAEAPGFALGGDGDALGGAVAADNIHPPV